MAACRCRCLLDHPALLWLVVLAPFVIWPGIDLVVSGWFYDPARGFFWRDFWLCRFVLKGLPPVMIGATLLAVLAGLAAAWRKRAVLGMTGRKALYLLASLALGPGLLVNALFKDHWHRARPGQVVEFGGQAHFTPVLQMADQCAANCSFSSGHGALGFWLIAAALLAAPRWRVPAIAAASVGAVLVGVVRIAQGGHFLSDVVFSGLLVVTLAVWLHRRLGLR